MNITSQRICATLGVLCPFVMFLGMIVAGFLPPLPPSLSAADTAAFYYDNATRVRIGGALMQIGGGLMIVFTAAVTAQLRRIESRAAPVLSYVQMGGGFVTAIPFIVPALIWITCTYRVERAPELTQMLSDFGWIFFMGFYFPTPVQNLAAAWLILADRRPRPIIPRWIGYFCVADSLVFPAANLLPFFKDGPFAWNGLFVFWTPAIAFGLWFPVMYVGLLHAIRVQRDSGADIDV